jgi:AraC-like DNA-binding protein
MSAEPNELTESPTTPFGDPIEEILTAMRLSGGVFIDAEFTGEWSIASHFLADQCALFFPVTGSLIGYHFVREGRLWAEVEGLEPLEAGPGSIVVFPRNDPHRIYTADCNTVSSQSVLDLSDPHGVVRMRHGTPGTPVKIFCGFLSASSHDTPLLDHLPAMLVIDPESGLQEEWLEASLRFATGGSSALSSAEVGRMAELMVRATLRTHLRSIGSQQNEWLQGLQDSTVARALSLIHRHYAEPIDIAWLSKEVGLSRSALHGRFVAKMGESPMRYCARWRMRQAANLLRETKGSIAVISYEVGFNSEAAFNRAFKREYGEPPSAWRQRKAAQLKPGTGFSTPVSG